MNPDELQNNRNINVCMSDSPPKASFANSRKTPSNHEEDFGNFPLNMNDNSFSDLNSDDSSAWMHKIDVSNFKILANDVTNDEISEILNENSHPNDINLSDSSTKKTLSNNNMLSNAALGANILSHSNLNFDDSKYSTNFLRYNSEPCIKKPKLVRHNSNLNSDSSNLSPPPHYSQHHHCPFPPQVFTPPVLDQYLFDHFGMNHPPPLNANSYESILQPNQLLSPTVSSSTKVYAKPLYSYSCLIALALKNSKLGRLQVSEIYHFMCENFPYFRTAPPGWKNSVRHNLSLNKCFEKIILENQAGHGRKCCLWTVSANKRLKMDQEIRKWRDKDPEGIRESLLNADDLDLIESGQKGLPTEKESQPLVISTLNDRQPSHSVTRPSSSVDWNLLMSHNPNRSLFTPAFSSFGPSSLLAAQPATAYTRFGSPNPLSCTSRPGSTPVNALYSSDESRDPLFPSNNTSQGAPYLLQGSAHSSHSRRTFYGNNNRHNVEFETSLPSTSTLLVGRSAETLLLEAESLSNTTTTFALSSSKITESKFSMSNGARFSLL